MIAVKCYAVIGATRVTVQCYHGAGSAGEHTVLDEYYGHDTGSLYDALDILSEACATARDRCHRGELEDTDDCGSN
jgi:hypothetical protein